MREEKREREMLRKHFSAFLSTFLQILECLLNHLNKQNKNLKKNDNTESPKKLSLATFHFTMVICNVSLSVYDNINTSMIIILMHDDDDDDD